MAYSCADWDVLHAEWRYVPWKDIFKLSASAAANEFCECVKVGIDLYIYISLILSILCCCHRNHFLFVLTKNSFESKVKVRHASN